MFERPDPSELHPYYAPYVGLVPDGDILSLLESQVRDTARLLSDLDPEQEVFRYAPEKWSVREVVGHVIDTERVFALRAFWFARNDPAALPGFDQDDFVASSHAHERPLTAQLEELRLLRASNLALFRSFEPDWGARRGIASGREFSVRAIVWILAGHELHHRAILEHRYLGGWCG